MNGNNEERRMKENMDTIVDYFVYHFQNDIRDFAGHKFGMEVDI